MRRNFLVPVPSFESFDALNAYLEQRCLERMDAQLRGHTETIGQRMERKPGALDQAAPLQGWALPDEFGTLRRLLESRMGRRGKREFVQVLRLLETFSQLEVHAAVKDAIHLGSLSFDAVKHLVLCRLEGRPPRLDMELYPHLPRVRVSTTSARDYMTLLAGRAA